MEFDVDKIAQAIFKAAQVLGGKDHEMSEYLAKQVELYLLEVCHNSYPTVEQVQDAVEKILIESGHARTAKEYILYRAERTRVRDMNTKLMRIYEDLTFKEAKDNDVKRENANIDGNTAMGTMLKYGSEGAKEFYKMYVINPKYAKAHENGDIHIHDMDFYTLTMTCCQIDLLELLKNGFSTGHGHLRGQMILKVMLHLPALPFSQTKTISTEVSQYQILISVWLRALESPIKSLYWTNLGKMLECMYDVEDGIEQAKKIGAYIEEKKASTLAWHGIITIKN